MLNVLKSLTRVRGHAISTIGLGPQTIVVDAGAHRGEFSRALADRFGCRCYLVEANADLAERLIAEDCYAGVAAAALGDRDGIAEFYLRENLESSSLDSRTTSALRTATTEMISLATLLDRFGLQRIDLLKLDVEGAEFKVLSEAPVELLTRIGQITVEFHDFIPSFQGQGLYEAAARRLHSLGFVRCPAAFRTHGDVLFLNRRQFSMNAFAELLLAVAGRWRLRLAE